MGENTEINKPMKFDIRTVTPSMASDWLEECQSRIDRGLFEYQRPISAKHSLRIANQIALGLFITTHQGIAFDTEGNLIDGRQRLTAITIAKQPVRIVVVTGCPKTTPEGLSTFDGIDRMRPRSVGNQLQSHGYAFGNIMSSIVNSIVATCSPTTFGTKFVAVEAGQAIRIYDLLRREYQTVMDILQPAKLHKRAPLVAPLIILTKTHRDAAIDFATKYATLENLPKGHPVLAFNTWLKNHPNLYDRDSRVGLMRAFCSALKNHIDGNLIDKLYAAESAQQWIQELDKGLCRKVVQIAFPISKITKQDSLKLAA